ncbi:MAG: TetR/AcrR family transcriptional regulator [Clostridia bacterium]|nr:TetR/AcrR family transcriptional regulator [Clostridia bacterium]
MAKKRTEKGSAKAQILETAMQLFKEQGINGTSLNDIATAASLSKGTLYYYYPAKDGLVEDIIAINTDVITEMFFAWVSSVDRRSTAEETIEELLGSILEQDDLCKLHTVISVEASRNPVAAQLLNEKYNQWAVILEMGTLKIRPREAQLITKRAPLFFTLLNGCMLDKASGIETDIKELAHIFLAK